jgi:FtsZ-binding cell division protein ZapB
VPRYNYKVIDMKNKYEGTVDLKKENASPPKYATIAYVDRKINEVNEKINEVKNELKNDISELRNDFNEFKKETNARFDELKQLILNISKK